MSDRAYCIFDTAIGRCGIAWSAAGIVGVQLAEAREIETRKRLFKYFPDARETRRLPTSNGRSRASVRCCAANMPISPISSST
jgi:hypothetical protein